MLAVLLTALAVAAVLVLPGVVLGRGPVTTGPGPDGPQRPRLLEPSGPQEWRPLDCPGFACEVPRRISQDGRELRYLDGTSVATGGEPGATVRWRLRGSGERWVLVGAEGDGPASDVRVIMGGGSPVAVQRGRLSLLLVPVGASTVYLLERGEPQPGQVLRILEYAVD